MTVEQARLIILEDALRQAQNTVQFLHGCLTTPAVFQYAYPHMTEQHLAQWAALVPPHDGCAHSRHHNDCAACVTHRETHLRLREAHAVLDSIPGRRGDGGRAADVSA